MRPETTYKIHMFILEGCGAIAFGAFFSYCLLGGL